MNEATKAEDPFGVDTITRAVEWRNPQSAAGLLVPKYSRVQTSMCTGLGNNIGDMA